MLDDLDLTHRTVVVVTSDHGEEFLEHGLCFHIRALYRETVHVPLVVSVPGLPARRVGGVVPASASVGPTILEMLGLTGLPGPSLRPLLEGQPRAPALDPYVVSETGARDPWTGRYGRIRSLTAQREKLVHWIDAGRVQYFDLARDPGEKYPISDGPRVQALVEELERWSDRHPPAAEPASVPALSAGLARELRRLGYVE
jgi:arylsulfatase A-like enzyme